MYRQKAHPAVPVFAKNSHALANKLTCSSAPCGQCLLSVVVVVVVVFKSTYPFCECGENEK